MTKIISRHVLTREQVDMTSPGTTDLVKQQMWENIGKMIVEKFPVYGRPYRDGVEYEISVFVYSEDEIRKIVGLLPSSDTARSIQAIYEILTKNRDELNLPSK